MHPAHRRIEDEYRRRTPRSWELHARACRTLPGGDTRSSVYHSPYPTVMASGAGRRISDVDGNRYLDCMNNATSLLHGHAFPPVMEAVNRQAALGSAWGNPGLGQIELAELLVERVESLEQIRFTNSGTEATLMAIRVARAFTGRDLVIKIEGGYHGTHDLVCASVGPDAEAAGEARAPRTVPQGRGLPRAIMDQVAVVPFNDADALSQLLDARPGQAAAIVVEPMLGSHGYVTATREYLAAVQELARGHGALFILDEVQTLRVDLGGAQARYEVEPDLTAMAKIIGGGLPVGAMGGRAEIMALFDPSGDQAVTHGGTFNGNPLVMAAGLAAMRNFTEEALQRINQLGDSLRLGMRHVAEELGIHMFVTGMGSLAGFHFAEEAVSDYRAAHRAPGELKQAFLLACLNHGLTLSPAGGLNVSTVMEQADIDTALECVRAALEDVKPLVADAFPRLLRS